MSQKLCSLLLFVASAAAWGQSTDAPVQTIPLPQGLSGILAYTAVQFIFVPRGPEQKAWEIEVRRDLTGTYRGKGPDAKPTSITVSEGTMRRLEMGDGAVNAHHCETKEKHIAQTGKKTITYVLGVALASCEFNYSDDEKLNDVASAFLAIAATMEMGEKLAHLHRYDRLGLDAEMDVLLNEAKEGRAIELQNIAPVLQSIVEDERVIDRVRRKAARLVQDAGP